MSNLSHPAAFVAALCLIFVTCHAARAEERGAPKMEVGAHFTTLELNPPRFFGSTVTQPGLGGRFSGCSAKCGPASSATARCSSSKARLINQAGRWVKNSLTAPLKFFDATAAPPNHLRRLTKRRPPSSSPRGRAASRR